MAEKEKDDVEYIAVEEEETKSPQETPDDEDEDSQDLKSDDDDLDEDENERDKIRERRRQEKKERKERRAQAIHRDRIELDFLRKRNDELERRLVNVEQRSFVNDTHILQQQLEAANNEITLAERVIAKAIEAGNGEDVTKAMRYRDEAVKKAINLDSAIKQQQVSQNRQQQQNVLDPMIATYAQAFLDDHPWYDTSGKDEDSAIVLAIDNALAKEGFDPKSERYWSELRKRVERRLPEKFKDDEEEQPKQKAKGGPKIGSSKEHAPTSTRKEVYISPERKAALIEAGVWDDPVLRQKYIKRYMEYDRTNSGR